MEPLTKVVLKKIAWILLTLTVLIVSINIAIHYFTYEVDHGPHVYIPDGYEGPVIIVFDQINGAETVPGIGKRVLKIPESGILLVKEDKFLDWRRRFFYTNDGEKRQELLEADRAQVSVKKEKSANYVFNYQETYPTTNVSNGKETPRIISFMVGQQHSEAAFTLRMKEMKKGLFVAPYRAP